MGLSKIKDDLLFLMEALNESILDSSRPLVPDLPAAGRRGSTTCIHAGESTQGEKCDFHGSTELAERPCFKINDLRHCQIIRSGAALLCAACLLAGAESLIESEIPYVIAIPRYCHAVI